MMFLKRIKVLILLLIVLLDAKSQTNIDSLAINFLVKNNQIKDSDIVYKKRVVKGKIITNQNIYIDKVFCLKENEETLNIYGFGTYSSESNRCMLFEYGYNSTNKYFFLGLDRIEEELSVLSNIFKVFKVSLKQKYEIQILEIFINYKKGKIEIPNHLNCLNKEG